MWEGNRNSTKKQAFKKTKLAIHMAAYVYSAGLVVEILENLIDEYENLDYRTYFSNNVGMWVSNEKEPKTDFRVFSPKQEEDQRLLLIHSEGKAWREYQDGEIEKLNRRLQILEDDAEVMKRAFFTSVEERKLFIHEIHGLFQIVHHFLCLQSQGRAEKEEHAGALIINPHKVIHSIRSSLSCFLLTVRLVNLLCYVWFQGK